MRLSRLHHAVATVLAAVTAGLVSSASLAAQTVTGRVVDSATRRPLARVTVRLVPGADSARDTVYAAGETAPDGVFVLAAPAPGRYRVRLSAAYVSSPLTLTTIDAVDEHEYPIGGAARPESDTSAKHVLRGAALDSALLAGKPLLAFQVEKPTAVVPGTLSVIYPEIMRLHRVSRGEVVAQFVVDTTGRADLRTYRVLRASDPAFADALRAGLARARFSAAEIGGRKVRQIAQLPATFAWNGPMPPDRPLFPPPYRPLPSATEAP